MPVVRGFGIRLASELFLLIGQLCVPNRAADTAFNKYGQSHTRGK